MTLVFGFRFSVFGCRGESGVVHKNGFLHVDEYTHGWRMGSELNPIGCALLGGSGLLALGWG
jgi:hypothetical protein